MRHAFQFYEIWWKLNLYNSQLVLSYKRTRSSGKTFSIVDFNAIEFQAGSYRIYLPNRYFVKARGSAVRGGAYSSFLVRIPSRKSMSSVSPWYHTCLEGRRHALVFK